MGSLNTETKQTWRKYAPEGKDIRYYTKAKLRAQTTGSYYSKSDNGYVKPLIKVDYSDDIYVLFVGDKTNTEPVMVVARQSRQIDSIRGVFDEVRAGVFFHVSDENFREAESKLTKIFS